MQGRAALSVWLSRTGAVGHTGSEPAKTPRVQGGAKMTGLRRGMPVRGRADRVHGSAVQMAARAKPPDEVGHPV